MILSLQVLYFADIHPLIKWFLCLILILTVILGIIFIFSHFDNKNQILKQQAWDKMEESDFSRIINDGHFSSERVPRIEIKNVNFYGVVPFITPPDGHFFTWDNFVTYYDTNKGIYFNQNHTHPFFRIDTSFLRFTSISMYVKYINDFSLLSESFETRKHKYLIDEHDIPLKDILVCDNKSDAYCCRLVFFEKGIFFEIEFSGYDSIRLCKSLESVIKPNEKTLQTFYKTVKMKKLYEDNCHHNIPATSQINLNQQANFFTTQEEKKDPRDDPNYLDDWDDLILNHFPRRHG